MVGKKVYYKDLGLGVITKEEGGDIFVAFKKDTENVYRIPKNQIEKLEKSGKLKWEGDKR